VAFQPGRRHGPTPREGPAARPGRISAPFPTDPRCTRHGCGHKCHVITPLAYSGMLLAFTNTCHVSRELTKNSA
jgi:hypothetical protein